MEPNGAMFCLVPGCNQYLKYQYSRNYTEEEHKGSGQMNKLKSGRILQITKIMIIKIKIIISIEIIITINHFDRLMENDELKTIFYEIFYIPKLETYNYLEEMLTSSLCGRNSKIGILEALNKTLPKHYQMSY